MGNHDPEVDQPSVQFANRVNDAAKIMGIGVPILREYLALLGVVSSPTPDTADDAQAFSLIEADTTTESDARVFMVDKGAVKVARFKAGWAILKGKSQQKAEAKSYEDSGRDFAVVDLIKTLRAPAQYSDEELLKAYKEDASTDIFQELNKRANTRAFIIFNEKNDIDVENSLKMLRIARRSETPAHYVVDGRMVDLNRVGQFPMHFLEECPVHKDTFLVEGYCEECKLYWGKVSLDARVWVRVAVDGKFIDVSSNERIMDLIISLEKGNLDRLTRIPAILHRFNELKDEGRLPVLRRKLSKIPGKSDPFFVHKSH